MNRRYFLDALKLGFTEMRLSAPERAILAIDGRRKYLWMPLSTEGALKPAKDSIRIESTSTASEVSTTPSPRKRTRLAMAESSTTASAAEMTVPAVAESAAAASQREAGNNGVATSPSQTRRTRVRRTNRQAVAGPIEQALALRDSLRESINKANELIRTLKRQRQHSKLVATTLASLKQLQQAG
jgi:hypothetical protein